MKAIELSRGMIAVISDEDFAEVSQHRWCFDGAYAVRRKRFQDGKSRKVYLHREIMGNPYGFEIDHKNRQKLDCRRENLRVCTSTQNRHNVPIQKSNKSGYRGVHYAKKNQKWAAQICLNNKIRHLGLFATAEEASRAYNTAALQLHGEFANTN